MLSPLHLITMPETSAYYHIAYTIALGIYLLYAVSLYVRRKKVRSRQ
jgi:Mg2+ and Co2+ transporter CorA